MSESNAPREPSRPELFRKALLASLRHNWGYKLLAFVLAVCLWAGLIAQDPNLTRTKTMADTAVTINGRTTLENRGLVITAGLPDNLTAEITANIPQLQYQNATGTEYKPRIELNEITAPGEQEVHIATTNSNTYGEVLSVVPASITLTVERMTANTGIMLDILQTGTLAEGWYLNSAQVVSIGSQVEGRRYVTVQGPESLVNRVERVQAVLDLGKIDPSSQDPTVICEIRPVDRDGNPIISDQIEIISNEQKRTTCYVLYGLLPTRRLTVSAEIEGMPAAGYAVSGITSEPATVLVAGRAALLMNLDAVSLAEPIRVDGAAEDVRQTVRLQNMPSGITLLNDSGTAVSDAAVNVTVTVHVTKQD